MSYNGRGLFGLVGSQLTSEITVRFLLLVRSFFVKNGWVEFVSKAQLITISYLRIFFARKLYYTNRMN